MGKKILILSASPRIGGNSDILCDEFLRGAEESGHSVLKLNIARMKVTGCFGCGACMRNGGNCVQKDDMEQIREKMSDADVIVLASPIYFYSMNAQLKAVIDRTYAFFSGLEGKTFYFIISCAAPDLSYAETMIAGLRGFTSCIPNSTEGGIIYGIGAGEVGEVRKTKAFAEAYEMGKAV